MIGRARVDWILGEVDGYFRRYDVGDGAETKIALFYALSSLCSAHLIKESMFNMDKLDQKPKK